MGEQHGRAKVLPGFLKGCREFGRGAAIRAGIEDALSMENRISLIKVFSVTKARERDALGDRVTAWIAANPQVQVVRTFLRQSSDSSFHCLSMVLLCAAAV